MMESSQSLPFSDTMVLSEFEFPQYICNPTEVPDELQKYDHQNRKSNEKLYNVVRPQHPDDVPGPINFDMILGSFKPRAHWIYSEKLQRLYIPINRKLMIRFIWTPTFEPLYLRSALIFDDQLHEHIPVQRCPVHMDPELAHNAGLGVDQLSHAFEVKYPPSFYETDTSGFLTTRTPLSTYTDGDWFCYHFCCLSSCPTIETRGTNKRPVKMVFMVEDAMGNVIAWKFMMIRICTNIKQQVDREEYEKQNEHLKNPNNLVKMPLNKLQQQLTTFPEPPPSNDFQVSSCNDDDENVYAVNLNIYDEENCKAIRKYAYDLMASQAIRSGKYELYKPHMDALLVNQTDINHSHTVG